MQVLTEPPPDESSVLDITQVTHESTLPNGEGEQDLESHPETVRNSGDGEEDAEAANEITNSSQSASAAPKRRRRRRTDNSIEFLNDRKWLPTRRARSTGMQLMELQNLQNMFEDKDFAEMEREERTEIARRKSQESVAAKPDKSEEVNGGSTESKTHKAHKDKESDSDSSSNVVDSKRKSRTTTNDSGSDASDSESNEVQRSPRKRSPRKEPRRRSRAKPPTETTRFMPKCAKCNAYNCLKICEKLMCSRCCPLDGAPCKAHLEKQKLATFAQPNGVAVKRRTPVKKENDEAPTKEKKRKKPREEVKSSTSTSASSKSSDESSESEEAQKEKSKRNKEVEANAEPNKRSRRRNLATTAASRSAAGDDNRFQKCARCHANNYLRACPKSMCKVCCPTDNKPCVPHQLKETMRQQSAEMAANRGEQDNRPVKFDRNGRRIPLKCSKCGAYNAMKNCAKGLCSICCSGDEGFCPAHAYFQRSKKPVEKAVASSSGSSAPSSPSLKKDQKRFKRPKERTPKETSEPSDKESAEALEAQVSTSVADDTDNDNKDFVKKEATEGEERQLRGRARSVTSSGFVPKKRHPARCAACCSNNALNACAKGMCSVCCPKGGSPCDAHSKKRRRSSSGSGKTQLGGGGDADPSADVSSSEHQAGANSVENHATDMDVATKEDGKLEQGNTDEHATPRRSRSRARWQAASPTGRIIQKCSACKAYNMLRTCPRQMCSVCCKTSAAGPCNVHMLRSGDADRQSSNQQSPQPRRGRKSDSLPSRRAKQTTITKMQLQQLQDEFESEEESSEEEEEITASKDINKKSGESPLARKRGRPRRGRAQTSSSESSSEDSSESSSSEPSPVRRRRRGGGNTRPRGSRSVSPRSKPIQAATTLIEEREEFVLYDYGSDYEEEMIDGLQFIMCNRETENKRQAMLSAMKPASKPNEKPRRPLRKPIKEEPEERKPKHANHDGKDAREGKEKKKRRKAKEKSEGDEGNKGPKEKKEKRRSRKRFTDIGDEVHSSVPAPSLPSMTLTAEEVKANLGYQKLQCANCSTRKTKNWHTGWAQPGGSIPVLLCDVCGKRFRKNMFCTYCNYIYAAGEDWNSTKWIGCDTCPRWIHRKCEERHLGHKVNSDDLYLCPACQERRIDFQAAGV